MRTSEPLYSEFVRGKSTVSVRSMSFLVNTSTTAATNASTTKAVRTLVRPAKRVKTLISLHPP